MPKLSIIIPVYKMEKYLDRCIESVLNQTFTDFECILVDDGSPDRCPQICDEYAQKDKRIRVIHKQNKGVSSARNMGLDSTKGEYISFIDSDDAVHSQMYELLFFVMESYGTDAVTIDISLDESVMKEKYDLKSVDTRLYSNEEIYKQIYRFMYAHEFWNVITCGLYGIYPKYAFNDFRFDEEIHIGEDLEAIIKINRNIKSVAHSKLPMYFHETKNISAMRSKVSSRNFTYLKSLEKIIDYLKENSIKDKEKFEFQYFIEFYKMYIETEKNEIPKKEFKPYKKSFIYHLPCFLKNKYLPVLSKLTIFVLLISKRAALILYGYTENALLEKNREFIEIGE